LLIDRYEGRDLSIAEGRQRTEKEERGLKEGKMVLEEKIQES
jgi:hypothetical protein